MKGYGFSISTDPPRLWRTYRNKFPNLNIEMISKFSTLYNCISFSIGVSDRWIWNEIDVNSDGTSDYDEFISFYARHGYIPTSNLDEAVIAMFGHRYPFGRIEVKHAARKHNGYWQSKMGQGGIIQHRNLEVFQGTSYGELLQLFKKATPDILDPRTKINKF